MLPNPSSRWLGLQLSSHESGRPLPSSEATRQGALWLDALPSSSICALLLVQGRALWREPARSGGPRSRALEGSLLWARSDRLASHFLDLCGPACHSALLLAYPVSWVLRQLGEETASTLPSDWRRLLIEDHHHFASLIRPLDPEDRAWAGSLMAPSLCAPARRLLESSRMSEFFFRKVLLDSQDQEFFCHRTRRLALERVERVRQALRANLENPPVLAELARLCGCNPHYLSRTFTETAGMTITHYLRKLRIERSMSLMARGTHNASEAALEVGYQSMSHFSVAFRQVQGQTPSEWARQQQGHRSRYQTARTARPGAPDTGQLVSR